MLGKADAEVERAGLLVAAAESALARARAGLPLAPSVMNPAYAVPGNIALSAPYMHDGSIATLAGVIEHYNSGGAPHKHKSEFVKPLNLTAQEKQDLLEFLMSLTDNDFIHNPNFAP